ncbi:MAG: hypothetical protein ACREV2_09675, partial [Burkholderiales bacterium]
RLFLEGAQSGVRRKEAKVRSLTMVCIALALLAACDKKPDVKFLKHGEHYSAKPDFAEVEHQHPIASPELAKITPKYLESLNQEQVDQIYARLSAGPIPDGAFDGALFFPKGTSGDKRIAEIIGGWKGFAANLGAEKLELVGKTLWKGKVFYRDQRLLRNRIDDLRVLKPLIEGDLSDIPKIDVKGRDAWLLFPARLYCGQSLLDSRRESIIIDYAFSDEIQGYRERPDFLASRRGLKIRDEIRMVRPGFYLGRAYADRAFLLNFTLQNDGKAGTVNQDCWTGTQVTAAK